MSDESRKQLVGERDSLDNGSRNSLMFASFYGNVDMVELLVAAGAEINGTDSKFRTCLHYASMSDNSKLIEAVFIAFKNQGDPVRLFGETEESGMKFV
jgi:ankyrin repeat protein